MGTSAKDLGIDRLSVDDRLRLIEEIWDGLDGPLNEREIPQWHKDEITHRIQAHAANPTESLSWDEVENRLRARREAE